MTATTTERVTATTTERVLAHLEVMGDPKPQGSHRAIAVPGKDGAKPKAFVKESNAEAHAAWRNLVAVEAKRARAELEETLDGPLYLKVQFRFAPAAGRAAEVLARGQVPKLGAPDLSKLIRALEDGLQAGGLIRDDARFVKLLAVKMEVPGWTGADVVIERWVP